MSSPHLRTSATSTDPSLNLYFFIFIFVNPIFLQQEEPDEPPRRTSARIAAREAKKRRLENVDGPEDGPAKKSLRLCCPNVFHVNNAA